MTYLLAIVVATLCFVLVVLVGAYLSPNEEEDES